MTRHQPKHWTAAGATLFTALPFILLPVAFLQGCGGGASGGERTGKRRVCVSIPPQAFFVEQVGGAHVEVDVLVAPGQSPHSFEPSPRQIARLAAAEVYFSIGVGFEDGFLPKLREIAPQLPIVDTREGIKLRHAAGACCAAHATADSAAHKDADHEHASGDDPHIWLDPRLAKVQARTIAAALAKIDPLHAAEYERNAADFGVRLDALHAELAEKLAPFKGRSFYVFHPAYGYFADAYGLTQVAVEINGREPSAAELTALIQQARAAGVHTIFYQPQYSSKSAEAIAAAIGGRVAPLDEMARDYVANLHQMADALVQSFTAGNN